MSIEAKARRTLLELGCVDARTVPDWFLSRVIAKTGDGKKARRAVAEALGMKRLPPGFGQRIDALAEPIMKKQSDRYDREWRDTSKALESGFGPSARDFRLILRTKRDFARCDYRRPSNKWAGGEIELSVKMSTDPMIDMGEIDCTRRKVWSNNGKWSGINLELEIVIVRSRARTILDGLSVVDGKFILWSREREAGYWHVIYGHQGRGLDIVTREGWVVRRTGEFGVLGETHLFETEERARRWLYTGGLI